VFWYPGPEDLLNWGNHLQRLFEGLRVIERLLDDQSVSVRLEYFNHFHGIAEFKTWNETWSSPAREQSRRPECRRSRSRRFSPYHCGTCSTCFLTDMDFADKVVRHTGQQLHLIRGRYDFKLRELQIVCTSGKVLPDSRKTPSTAENWRLLRDS